MKRIFKWTLTLNDFQSIEVPEDTKFLTVQTQYGQPQIWGLCTPAAPKKSIAIRIAGTGHPIEGDPGMYAGTFQLKGGSLIFHVFIVT